MKIPRRVPDLPPLALAFALLAPFASALLACRAASEPAPSAGGATTEVVRVAAADPVRLTADVTWLADDAREGRRAGTPGERAAAEWLAARMADLGLEPAGGDGYLQAFDVPLEPEEGGRSWIMALPGETEGGGATDAVPQNGAEQIVPLFCSAGGGADGPLAFRGYGMIHEERDWNDYPERVDGEVVMIVRGTPAIAAEPDTETEVENPHAVPSSSGGDVHIAARTQAFGNSGSIFNKVMTAKRMGAKGVILAQHPDDRGEPLLAFHNGHTAKASIPAVTVSAAVAERLLPGYRERVGAIDALALETGRRDVRSHGRGGAVALSADVTRGTGTARNVLGLLRGTEGRRTLVVGAHFDHLGLGGSGSLARESWGEIHNGADDNASGTAAVLELARLLTAGPPLEDDVLFALWSGEELGLLGSEHWAEHPTVPLERVALNLNFDMVGRADAGVLQVLGAGTAESFGAWLDSAGPRAGLDLEVSRTGQGIGGSDHQTFLKRAIPALHFFSGVHTDYHKPSDDAERFEAGGAARTVDLALDLVRRADAADDLAFVEIVQEKKGQLMSSGWSSWFGSVPNYGWSKKGVKIDGTSAGSPAEQAGLLGGDVLLEIADIELETIDDFMYVLQTHKPGDVVAVRYLRDDEEETLQLTLGSRALE